MNEIDANAVLIVTGAHLGAELHDRPLAYFLRDKVAAAMGLADAGARVVVCSDLWYLNHDELRAYPTISIGGPGVSALGAYLASRLPSVLAVEGVYVVQMDPESEPPVAACWGKDADSTGEAVQAFASRHLAEFLESCE
ncbi:hypothetical protein PHYC_01188 [Phycisphaerales bacterium]|nr:hypothetical protein PHYC_01188 [Phycisphaerales bacterium]